MILVTQKLLDDYMEHDYIQKCMCEHFEIGDDQFDSSCWHAEDSRKRLIYYYLYQDLLWGEKGRRVLDVGGGFTSASRELSRRQVYKVVDPSLKWGVPVDNVQKDWYVAESGKYDIVIANDIFPNVDQRLELFLARHLHQCKELRMSLTFFNEPKWYNVANVASGEHLTMKALTGQELLRVIEHQVHRIKDFNPEILRSTESIFDNGRQICLITFKGDLAEDA